MALGGEGSQGLYRGMGALAPPLDALDLPAVSAFLLGVLAAFAPCQATTGAGALGDGGRLFPGLPAFLLGQTPSFWGWATRLAGAGLLDTAVYWGL